ncbi:ATP-binding protein [Streptomyces nodosus]|uniref:ATP-binding protein n=1 Tax=Streptomyces nodosus TaxID=40318 RepID=UPI0034531809
MTPEDQGLPTLDDDLNDTVRERAVACVTGPGAADAVRTALARAAAGPHVEVTAPRGASTTGFAHTLYTALRLDVHHGPPPAERSAAYRRIDAHLARRSPVLLVPDAHTLRRAVLQDLLGPWKHDNGPCCLILTGTHRLRPAIEAAQRDGAVQLWLSLDNA